ncbi:MAG: IS1595 family transposase, partial [Draconibacterium sp.]
KLSTYRGKLFYRLMQQAVDTAPVTFNDITKTT